MTKRLNHLILFFFLVLLSACQQTTEKPSSPSKKPVVLVTLLPYKYLVEKIGGDTVEVITFVPKRKSAHHFTPSLREIEEMGTASIWFRIGEPIESKALKAFTTHNPEMLIVNLADGIDLLPFEQVHGDHTHSFYDPHFWLAPSCLKIQIAEIGKTLAAQFPHNSSIYQERTAALLESLDRLDEQIKTALTPLQTRTFLTSHSSFGYFCRDYQLEEIPVEYKGKEPTLPELETILRIAKEKQVKLMILIRGEKTKGGRLVADYLHLNSVEFDHLAYDVEANLKTLSQLLAKQDEHNPSR